MPRDDGLLARFDPESVSDTPPSRLVTVPRLTLGVHALVAAVSVTFALLAVTRAGSSRRSSSPPSAGWSSSRAGPPAGWWPGGSPRYGRRGAVTSDGYGGS